MAKKFVFAALAVLLIYKLHAQSVFQKSFVNENGCQANTIIQTQNGGYALAGWYDVDGLFSAEFFLVLMDAAGDTLWMRTYGKNSDTSSFTQNGSGNEGYDLVQTPDGGFMFAGERHEIAGGTSDTYVVRIGPDGELLWSRMYGGQENEYGLSVSQSADGNFVIGGFSESHGAGIRDMHLFKIDGTGDTLWTRTYGGKSIDAAMATKPTGDGGYIMAGYSFSYGAGSSDVFVIRTDQSGNIIWQKTFGGALNDIGHDVIQTNDGGFLVVGETESFSVQNRDIYLIKMDANGAMEWSHAYGGADYEAGNSVAQATDNGFILAGYTRGFGAGAEDFFVLKTDETGTLLWSRTYGGEQDDAARSVMPTDDNGFVVTGYSRSFGDGSLDAYLLKADSLGASDCGQVAEGVSAINVMTIESSPVSEIGYGTILKERTTIVGKAIVEVVDPCEIISHVVRHNSQLELKVYPNPAGDMIYFQFSDDGSPKVLEVTISDISGRLMKTTAIPPADQLVDVSDLANGVYMIHLKTQDGIVSRMFVKS